MCIPIGFALAAVAASTVVSIGQSVKASKDAKRERERVAASQKTEAQKVDGEQDQKLRSERSRATGGRSRSRSNYQATSNAFGARSFFSAG